MNLAKNVPNAKKRKLDEICSSINQPLSKKKRYNYNFNPSIINKKNDSKQ